MSGKRGLGKGIDALIPMTEKSVKKHEQEKVVTKEVVKEVIKETEEIDINKIEPNKNQPRKAFNEDALQELAESIKQRGIIQPIVIQKEDKGFYSIIAGERRWRAAKIAGLKKVPVVMKNYTSQEVMEIALIENLQREDLNPIEEAEAYQSLIKEYHLKQDEVAEKVSKSRVAVTNSLRLLKLDERVRTMLIDDQIKSGHARALLAINDQDLQYTIAQKIFDENLSVRETEKLVRNISKPNSKKKKEKIDETTKLIFHDFEEKMKQTMGTKVHINQKGKSKGKIEIEYYSKDDLERIIDMILGK